MKKYIMIIRYVSLIVHKVMWMTQAAVPVIQNIYENVTYLNMLITITNCSPTINSTLPIVTIHYMCTWNDKYSCHSEGEYPSLYCLIKTHCFCNFMQCLSSPKGVNCTMLYFVRGIIKTRTRPKVLWTSEICATQH